ncbi:Histone-lysine N-methyltransferase, H3 lysine-79 specific [Teratosphaeria destructans]|uniref:Histone-lysine N-methyltransferase, H3 lysine-79 specific n=1 Tax=Teratosphaeria destructans TaxID=418781 RepID=A0A9W7W711_9PEZI|nr:Histone-lysine N-methyltransferase, H3 lysine-79 specific [Teratosphaeria destructans]
MNLFSTGSSNKPATAAKKPTITRTTVKVPVRQPAQKPSPGPAQPSRSRFQLSENRTASSASPRPAATSKKPVVERALARSRGLKRKSATPDHVTFSDDEDEGDSSDVGGGSDSDGSRKRIKSSVSSVSSLGPPRRILHDAAFAQDHGPLQMMHGADATSGEYASLFKLPWSEDDVMTLELQYPSRYPRERFELKMPKSKDDYKPMEDITNTIEMVAKYYFPDELYEKYYRNDETRFERKFIHAWQREDVDEFRSIVEDYNDTVESLVDNGTIQQKLENKNTLELELIRRILDQIFARTVSPRAEILNKYTAGSDNVYGELLPRFCSDIFKKTRLTHEQCFIDLGSGVGNVVLQAALEVGCESWGIEMMPNPCDLAELQAAEFKSRAKLWGLDVGSVNLMRGDMTQTPALMPILQRADVILVNNQAFTPQLNDKLLHMFLDLKEGARIVSLKPFVPEGHKIQMRTLDDVKNQFVPKKFEYFSDSVSWSHYGNENWYIATKDLRPLKEFTRRYSARRG